MDKIVLQAADLDGYLTEADAQAIARVSDLYGRALEDFSGLEPGRGEGDGKARERVLAVFNELGELLRDVVGAERRIHVYSLETPEFIHGEASRLVAKLRDERTANPEFVYYIQRAYEMLFNLAFAWPHGLERHPIFVRTPVTVPRANYAVHKIPDIDAMTSGGVMCVMLRAALLPSMIVAKEIQEYSRRHAVTPFALFKISRDDGCSEHDMAYVLDLKRSYFDIEMLRGRDLFFADPMNATGGSLVTVIRYLRSQGIAPRSVRFFNVVSTLKGALRIVRAVPEAEIYTLWMDPAMNDKAYILPGLGDAGDRINGPDRPDSPRDVIQLIADYGTRVTSLYRDQIRQIEKVVLHPSRGILKD
ncbi:MAG: uracil phosphoribosyltransferase [Candidatus Aminicenantes bacterium]|nr:uracil phosphoribosyltransferase [Candidatus Aminicenantes bacterium]